MKEEGMQWENEKEEKEEALDFVDWIDRGRIRICREYIQNS
jgi:hypothetical protein